MSNSFRLDDSHSLYLLGQKSSSPLFQRYRSLMDACAKHGEFLSFETIPEWLSCYEQDAQHLHVKLPLLVFRPYTLLSISPFLQACHQLDLSVNTRCGGTGLAGSCVPSTEGVVLLTGHFKQMSAYQAEKGTICLEPGVTVRQLNRYVEADHWYFPLSMATEGVAGIAGCLSCQARGYHQQQQTFLDSIECVTLVDGQGQILEEVPASLVCGAEGLWGVIIEVRMQLRRKPPYSQGFIYEGSWQNLLAQLDFLRSLHSLSYVVWMQEKFYLRLEGEEWRLTSAAHRLAQSLPGLQSHFILDEHLFQSFLPSQKPFVVISSVFYSSQLIEACQWSLVLAKPLQLVCHQQADVLAGSLQLILQSEDNSHRFAQKIEEFLVLWINFVDRQQGAIASCHGVGMQMRPYMTPFWTEETQKMWRKMQAAFDSKRLFGKERFFPSSEKCLEKVRDKE